MPRYQMAIDASKCLNCKACLLACQQQNNVPFGSFRNWVKVTANPNELAGFSYQAGNCMQCKRALCVDACPTGATYYGEDGVVYIDKNRCVACGSCVSSCPYNARFIDTSSKVADKCDYCAQARAQGIEPACVRVCITRVRKFGDVEDKSSEISKYLESQKERGLNYIEAKNTKTEPSLAYVGDVYPTDWAQDVEISKPIDRMSLVAKATTVLGGLSFFGVIGVFIKQLFLPSDNMVSSDTHTDENVKEHDNVKND